MSVDLGRRVVVDASVVNKLWSPVAERHTDQVDLLVQSWERGDVTFVAPQLIELEVLNAAARKWGFTEPALLVLVNALRDLKLTMLAPALERIAFWAGRGLTAYDSAYVAVAEAEGIPLVTDDDQIVGIAGELAVPLGSL